MHETPKQYTRRVLGYIEGEDPVRILGTTPGRIARLIRGVPKKRLALRAIPDKWSVAEILAHLADTELLYGFRVRRILEANGAPIQGIDQDAWAGFSDYAKQDPALSLEAFRATRERLVRLLRSLPKKRWTLWGMHSERGKETLTRTVEMLAGHDINHLMQIKARLPK